MVLTRPQLPMKWRIGFTIEMRTVPSNTSGNRRKKGLAHKIQLSCKFVSINHLILSILSHVERNHSFVIGRNCCRCFQVVLKDRKGMVKAFPRTKEIAPITFTIWCSNKYQQGIFVLQRNTWDLTILNWENLLKITYAGINTGRSKHTFYHPFSIDSTI